MIVTRGLGRRAAAAALIVTAGLGLAGLPPPVDPPASGGSSAYGGRHLEQDLADQVRRGERDSGGWWGYVAPKRPPRLAAGQSRQSGQPAESVERVLPQQASPPQALSEPGTAPDAAALAFDGTAEVVLVLAAAEAMPTTVLDQQELTDEEAALVAALIAACV